MSNNSLNNAPQDEAVPSTTSRSELFQKLKYEQDERLNNERGYEDELPLVTMPDDQVPRNMPGAILMHARELLNVSQKEIAIRLKLRIDTISDIENDRLNQSTAAPFVKGHLYNYARLVNLDPNLIIELYERNVDRAMNEADNNYALKHSGHRNYPHNSKAKYLIILALLIIIIALVFFFAQRDDSDTKLQGDLENTIDLNAQSTVMEDNSTLLEPVGELKAEDNNGKTEQAHDVNTQMAHAQAEALGTNEIKLSERDTSFNNESTDAVLALKPSTTADNTIKAKSHAENADKRKPNTSAQEILELENKALKLNQHREQKIKLKPNLTDISNEVMIKDRDGLASLNNVTIRIRDEVYLRVYHSSSKLLREGIYKRGDVIKLVAIPPIEVQVSDSSRINILYMGGKLSMPYRQQVKFTLPTR